MYLRSRLLLLLCLLLCCSLPAQKTGKRLKKRAKDRTEQKANQRLDKKIDRGVDKAFGAIEGLFGKKNKAADTTTTASAQERVADGGLRANDGDAYADDEEAAQAFYNALGIGDEQAGFEPYENPTVFSLTATFSETKRNGKEENNSIRLGATRQQFAMLIVDGKGSGSQMILSTQDGKTTTITTDKKGKKQGYRMRMPNFSGLVAEQTEELMEGITYERTGERRTIDGYDCEKIVVTDASRGAVTESWVTQDLPLTHLDVFGGMAGMAGARNISAPEAPLEGFAILSTTSDGKSVTRMHLTDIKLGEGAVDQSLFDTSGVVVEEVGW